MAASPGTSGNRLLDALPPDEWERILPRMETVELRLRDCLYDRGETIDHVYFPVSAVTSMVTDMEDGSAVEVATVGSEGMAGLPVFLQSGFTATHRCFAQVAGLALKLPSSGLAEILQDDGALHHLLHRYTQALMSQIAQTSACNRVHSIEQRCARWLLMTHDRVSSDEFQLTQEFLAQMLGVQRSSVNGAASSLAGTGAMRYSRGQIEVTDRGRLEAASCECYGVVAAEFERLIG